MTPSQPTSLVTSMVHSSDITTSVSFNQSSGTERYFYGSLQYTTDSTFVITETGIIPQKMTIQNDIVSVSAELRLQTILLCVVVAYCLFQVIH